MYKNFTHLFFLPILLAIVFVAEAQKKVVVPTEKIDSLLLHFEKHDRIKGSLSIFQNGKEVYLKSFGQPQQSESPTLYQIGSVTKLFTAVLIFDLIEKKRLDLQTSLATFYPQMPQAEKITVQHLLEHKSGLGDYTQKEDSLFWLVGKKWEETAILEEIKKQGVQFEAGTQTAYSNSAYFLLVGILEKIHQKPYYQILNQKIETVLKPTSERLLSAQEPNWARLKAEKVFNSYEYKGDTKEWTLIEDFEFANVVGVGDLAASPTTLNRLMVALFEGSLLEPSSLEKMLPTADEPTFGRGLMRIPFYQIRYWGHGGDTYGTHTILAYQPENQTSIALCVNAQRYSHNELMIGVLSQLHSVAFELPDFKPLLSYTENELQAYEGTYSSEDFPLQIKIWVEAGALRGQATGQPDFPLLSYQKDVFEFELAKLKLHFEPQKDKMTLYQAGMAIEMQRQR
ncbi:serine hydrolase domain-containing protein [Hugenholtzia roseola]|uniref:serine hydrolase domain-containing protein n=1 Tax=Hugenholtzia roseola TaxID=1002 RepID=UPI0012B5CEFE|nr:serine hydrolase domain-containing protein [Hugenholtzia roseola]